MLESPVSSCAVNGCAHFGRVTVCRSKHLMYCLRFRILTYSGQRPLSSVAHGPSLEALHSTGHYLRLLRQSLSRPALTPDWGGRDSRLRGAADGLRGPESADGHRGCCSAG